MLGDMIRYLKENRRVLSVEEMTRLMYENIPSPADLSEFIKVRPESYSREPVASSKFHELLVMTWAPGQASPIHNHKGSSCVFRVISGEGRETVFELKDGIPVPKHVRTIARGDLCVSYEEDVHKISSTNKTLVTMHFYSPPLRMETFPPVADSFEQGLGI